MTFVSLFVGVVVFSSGLLQTPPAVLAESGQLRWVRGTVTETSSTSLTVQLRDKAVSLVLDSDSKVVPAFGGDATLRVQAGARVEVHYLDKKPARAVLILDGIAADLTASKRPGRSYRGVISRIKRSAVSVRIATRTRGVTMEKNTKLVDVDGRSLAIGGKAISGQLAIGDPVLVTYDEQSDDVFSGDVYIPGSHQRALEIRRLAN